MGKRVLLVENNKLDARKIGQFLHERGYEVALAADGQEGFDLFVGHPPDVAVVDMLLPKISGSELCARLRETTEGRSVPLVLISSIFKNMQLARIAKSRWGVDLFFEKPLDLPKFAAELAGLIGAPEARTAAPPTEPPPVEPVPVGPVPVEPVPVEPPPVEAASVEPIPAEPARMSPARSRTVVRRTEFHLKQVPLSGDLAENSVPEILIYLYYHEESGTLLVQSREAKKKVYVRDGVPVYVESALREESLGRMLVREGVITEEDCFLSLQNMRTYHKQQGGALVQAGVLTPLQLMEALRRQMRQKVVGLFAWFEGEYSFERKKIKSERVTVFETPLPPLIVEGVRAHYDPATIRAIFEEIRHLRLRRKDYLPFDVAVLGLADAEARLLDLADGTRNVERILHETPLGAAESYQFLYAMMLLGVFEGLIEEDEIAEGDAEAASFPDIDFLEEQAERAARALEEATAAPERRAAPLPEAPAGPSAAVEEGDAAASVAVDLDDLDALDLASPPAGLQVLAEPASTAFVELSEEDRALRDAIVREFLALEGANHYQVMGVARDADVEEIKRRYLVMAKTFHADALGRKFDPGVVQKANEVFARATEAYKVLIDASRRLQYDRRLTESGEEKKERKVANILTAENHFKRGQEHLKRRAFDLAAAEFLKAIELFPEESEFHASLGWSIYNAPGRPAAEKFDEAVTLIQKGIALNPKSDVAYLYLGRVLKDRGQGDAAMQAFAQAFKFNRMNAEARQELKTLQIERARARRAPDRGSDREKASLRRILTTDVDLDTVKKSILKIFWS